MLQVICGFVVGLLLAGLGFGLVGGGVPGLIVAVVLAALGYIAASTLTEPERRIGKMLVSALPNGQKTADTIDAANARLNSIAMQAQVLKDFKSKLDRFAKRLDDLDRISVVTLQTAPQIKIIQNADQTIVDKIDTTISTTIPVWKSQMVIALGLSNQRKALDLQNKADEVTNKLLARNAAALHKGAVDAEKANQRSVVEIDTLEKINAELVATLKETVQIQKEGKANREAAQVKMRQIESDLKNALLENAQQM